MCTTKRLPPHLSSACLMSTMKVPRDCRMLLMLDKGSSPLKTLIESSCISSLELNVCVRERLRMICWGEGDCDTDAVGGKDIEERQRWVVSGEGVRGEGWVVSGEGVGGEWRGGGW